MKTSVPKKADKFPLFKHPRGYWCKTVLGKHRYFGRVVDDPKGTKALKRWLAEKEWHMAGLEPPASEDEAARVSLKYVCNKFMEAKEANKDAGELAQRTYDELYGTCRLLMDIIPKSISAKVLGPEHFRKVLAAIQAKYKSPNSRGKFVGQVRSIFRHAYRNGYLDRPTNFGTSFEKPKSKAYKKHADEKGDQSFTSEEIRRLLEHADINARAMILLATNAGFLNTELSELPRSVIKGEFLEWRRSKTYAFRRVHLWPETVKAIQEAIKAGPADGELVFYRRGNSSFIGNVRNGGLVGKLFQKVAKAAKVEGHCFRDFRYTFQTQAENAKVLDLPAIKLIMGHADKANDMSARYRQSISDERLKAVTNHVRQWLFAAPKKRGAK